MTAQDKLIHFLIKERLYQAFLFNFVALNPTGFTIRGLCRKCEQEQLIDGAFVWCHTSQGFNFWGRINLKWLKYVRSS